MKLPPALARLVEEDPTPSRRAGGRSTGESWLSGIGELHLRVALRSSRTASTSWSARSQPTIAYRETITGRAEGHYRLKKQTGGAGQFAEVFLRIEPLPRGTGYEFASEVFGGAIPTQYIPPWRRASTTRCDGPLAGFPVHDVRVVVYDGKSHPVDTKDIAFRTAAKLAFRDAFEQGAAGAARADRFARYHDPRCATLAT